MALNIIILIALERRCSGQPKSSLPSLIANPGCGAQGDRPRLLTVSPYRGRLGQVHPVQLILWNVLPLASGLDGGKFVRLQEMAPVPSV